MNPKYHLEQAYKEGTISRREFLQRSALIGATVALPGAMMAGAARAEMKRGGVLRLGMGGGHTTDSIDPGLHEDSVAITIERSMRSYLMEVSPSGELIGEVATSWESKPGAAEWTFELRQGIEFHNGKTLTAEDVIYSVQHHIRPDSTSKVAGQMGKIAEMKADGNAASLHSV